jgi:flagellar hook-associated protein 2
LQGNAPAALTITEGVNDQLVVTLDNVTATIALAPGTYASADAIAAAVQGAVNGAAAFTGAGSTVSVTQSGGVLTLTSNRYGSASNVALSGSAAATLVGNAPTATAGVDVAGTIDGVAASGSGQKLVAAPGSRAEGLALTIDGGAPGARGSVTFARGVADRLATLLDQALGDDGALDARTSGLQKHIDDLEKRKDALNARLAQMQANYYRQFNALDTLLANLSAQSASLAQALASLPKIAS